MYKIKCISGTSFFNSLNRKWLDYCFTNLELVKHYVENLSVIHSDCIFEICEE